MTTKQMLFSALILGAATNNALAMETQEKNTTHFQYENGSVSCTINKDHIVYNAQYKRKPDGSCTYSGPLMLSEINDALKNQSELPMSVEKHLSADAMGIFTASDCDCRMFMIFMKDKNNPEKLRELYNQAIKTQQ